MKLKLFLMIITVTFLSYAEVKHMTLLDSSESGDYEYLVGKLLTEELIVIKVFSNRSDRSLVTINNFREKFEAMSDVDEYKIDLKKIYKEKADQTIVKFSTVEENVGMLVIFKKREHEDQKFYVLLKDLKILDTTVN